MKQYILCDRKRGCKVVRNAFDKWLIIEADTEPEAEQQAIDMGYPVDWDAGEYHLIALESVHQALRPEGK